MIPSGDQSVIVSPPINLNLGYLYISINNRGDRNSCFLKWFTKIRIPSKSRIIASQTQGLFLKRAGQVVVIAEVESLRVNQIYEHRLQSVQLGVFL